MSNSNYSAKDVQILKGLEPIRRRPAMYISGVDIKAYHHLLREVVDNAIDEFLDGHVKRVRVKIDRASQVVEVWDDGRGIPVEKHPDVGISTLTALFTRLHAGGKFGRGAYASAVGGLHGVGIKAVNALSDWCEVWTVRRGKVWHQRFERGKAVSKVEVSKRKLPRGTAVRFVPDATIFHDSRWVPNKIAAWLHDTAFLCPGLRIRLQVDDKQVEYEETGGLQALLAVEADERPLLSEPLLFKSEAFDAALCWADGEGESWRSYVNVLRTPAHGTHVKGLQRAVADALNEVAAPAHYRAEDLRDGLLGVVHAHVLEPTFQGQTKTRLENPELEPLVYDAARQTLQRYFAANPDVANKLLERAKRLQSARDKFRAEQQAIKGTRVARGARGILPHKLVEAPDCSPKERELFVVEGNSAEGSAAPARVPMKKNGKNVHFQEVYPLRGKFTNAARKLTLAEVAKNDSIKDLFTAIGTGVGDAFDIRKCRYNGIYLLADADPDGRHIIALLLSLFVRHMPDLIRADMVRVVQNPLFMGTTATKRVFGDTVEEIRQQLGKSAMIRRFKGVGELNADELQECATDPKTRRVLRVVWDEENDTKLIMSYMGKDGAARKELLDVVG